MVRIASVFWLVSLPAICYAQDPCPPLPGKEGSVDYCPAPLEYVEMMSVFDQLSVDEVKSVAEYLATVFDIITEEPPIEACSNATRLFKVTKFPTPKAEVLDYVDYGGPMPDRYAEAMIVHGPIDIMHYKVGPLPIEEGSVEVIPITEHGEIPWGSRPYLYGCERDQERTVVNPAAEVLSPIFKATTNGWCIGLDECKEGLSWSLTADPISSPFNRISVVRFRISPTSGFGLELNEDTGSPSSSLFVLPLTFKLNAPGPDPADWYLSEYEYCGQGPFTSAEELLDLWTNGHVKTCHTGIDDDYDASWSTLAQRGELRKYANFAPPIITEPEGPRFEIEGRHISWMDWSFHFDLHPSWGPVFHDVNFKGDRLLYELALMETYAAYSGNSGHGEIMFLDAHYSGLGNRAYALQRGVDCPETAVYLPGPNMIDPFNPSIRTDSQCIFEMIGQSNVRHTARGVPKANLKSFLVVKQVITVGNYDYVLSYEFHLDGEFFIKMDAAGYAQTSYWYEGEEGFGVPVQLWQVGVLHDHLFSFKMDFDILGTENNFKETRFEVVPARGPTNTGRVIKKAVSETIETEEGFVVNSAIPRQFVVYNPEKKNKWGTPRGYTLHFEGTVYNILPPTHPWSRAASWSNYNVMVTKRKEEEQVTSHEGNMLVGSYPIVDSAAYMDGESIIEEDLVLWTTIGKMHLPRSEDIPVVTNFGVALALRPWDYFDENQAFDMPYKPTDFESCGPLAGTDYNYTTPDP